jgi:glycosyltransferase involved in cell wall biosynthesis
MSSHSIGINLLCLDPDRLTGVGNFFKRLMEHLPSCDAEFVFFCQSGCELESVVNMPAGIRYSIVYCPQFRNSVQRIAYEQIVLPFLSRRVSVLFSPCVANPIVHPGFRTITTVHDITPFFIREKYSLLKGWYVRTMTRLLAHASDRIVTVSQNSKQDLTRVLGLDSGKIDVIYNSALRRPTLPIAYGDYFLCVGTRQPGKNLEGVIESFARFRQKHDVSNHRLIVVGDAGWGGTKYLDLVRLHVIEHCVEFTGYVSEQGLAALYAGCKGVILLSLYEGFGIPPLEALSYSKPSIVSNRSSLLEVIGATGIAVDPFDYDGAALAMHRIATEPQAYLHGRDAQLKKFSPDQQSAAFLHLLAASAKVPQSAVM